ncbi:MAG: type II toxin-antitoxin system VapC family toxin [Planctomycetota bacterium]|nr:type II toxin-antitoxin system VapC family toxin [Planctomycetota bacterium]
MILADTSIWIDHFRKADTRLSELLVAHSVAVHPVVIGEIACGNLAQRSRVLALLRSLPHVDGQPDAEVLALIEEQALFGRGLGWGDVSILAGALKSGVAIWSRDRALSSAAQALGIRTTLT